MLNWAHLDALNTVLNLFCFWIVIKIVVIIQWSSICLALMRYLPTGQWRVTVRESDPCTWYSFKKKHSHIVIRKEWLWSPTDFFVMFLLVFFCLTWRCTTCWNRGDHFSHFVRRHWHIDDSSGLGRCYLVLPLKLAIMLNWMHLDVLDIVLNLFCFWIVIRIVVIIQWSSICLALSRYLLTGQWRVTVLGSDPCTWYSFKKTVEHSY